MSDSSIVVTTTGDKLQTYVNDLGPGPVHSEAVTPTDPTGVPFDASNPQYVSLVGSGITLSGNPLDAYSIADTPAPGLVLYHGFLESSGKWYIMKEDKTGAVYTYRYANLSNNPTVTGYHSGATPAYTNRASLTYDYLDVLTGL